MRSPPDCTCGSTVAAGAITMSTCPPSAAVMPSAPPLNVMPVPPMTSAAAVPELIAPGLDGMGERLVRIMLALMSDDQRSP